MMMDMHSAYFNVAEHTVPAAHIRQYPHATLSSQEEVLQLAVKQYTPRQNTDSNSEKITIIAAHANGFPKELYEPLWDELYLRSNAAGFKIRDIWIADVAQQGASGTMNELKLGNDPSWLDHPRDLFLIINHFRHKMQRPIYGIGHSMGASQLATLSLMHPRLFEGLVLLDPVILRVMSEEGNFQPARASSMRRDLWPSREVAVTSLRRHPFFSAWDSRVQEKFFTHGLRELPTAIHPHYNGEATSAHTASVGNAEGPPVTLSTTKHQEVFTFLRPNFENVYLNSDRTSGEPVNRNRRTHPDWCPETHMISPFYRAETTQIFAQTPFIRPGVHFVFGGQSVLSTPKRRQELLSSIGTGVGGSGGVAAGRVTSTVMEQSGHLLPMESVEQTAGLAAVWLGDDLKRWRAWEDADQKEWDETPAEDRVKISEETMQMLGGHDRPRERRRKL